MNHALDLMGPPCVDDHIDAYADVATRNASGSSINLRQHGYGRRGRIPESHRGKADDAQEMTRRRTVPSVSPVRRPPSYRSRAEPSRNTASSLPLAPRTWKPTGSPLTAPQGIDSAGIPAMFCGALKRVNASTTLISLPLMWTVVSPIVGGLHGSTAPTRQSSVSNTRLNAVVSAIIVAWARTRSTAVHR